MECAPEQAFTPARRTMGSSWAGDRRRRAGTAVRVVGGEWRGRPLVAPAGRGTRPTSDKVREAMFDVLLALQEVRAGGDAAPAAGPLGGHVVLDLFAGTGALGIEALPRGAGACTFVEHERAALRALRANLERLGVTVGARDRREEGDDCLLYTSDAADE